MADMFVLLQLPNAGDDLQAIKRGVMELADLVVINKADLDEAAATRARAQITSALRLVGWHGNPERSPGRPKSASAAAGGSDRREREGPTGLRSDDKQVWHPQVLQLSALKEQGLDEFWQAVQRFRELQTASSRFEARRHVQDQAWMWERIEAGLKDRFRHHPAVEAALPQLTADVRAGHVAASVAARRLLDLFH
jgi:LAO/AO transport system kinase